MGILDQAVIPIKKENKMKEFIKRIFGIDKIEAKKLAKAAEEKAAQDAKVAEDEAEKYASMSPKEQATANKESYIAVVNTHVNKDNVRNGFFELDWNEFFVLQLRQDGYQGTTDEEVVDKWFQELCRNVGAEDGVDMDRRGSGHVRRALLDNGKSEVY
jgi:hypothetical protein